MANTAQITQSATETLTLQVGFAQITQSVLEALVGLGISCDSPPDGRVTIPYTHTFPAGSGDPPYTFSLVSGSLPPGLTLDASTGIVSGTPTLGGTYNFTIQVTDSLFATAIAPCSIFIAGSIPTPVGGGPVGRCQNPKARPSILTKMDWSAFQRKMEALRPQPVEEARTSRFQLLDGTIRRKHGRI